MTTKGKEYENKAVSFPVGLHAKAKACGFNVSAVCADALNRKIIAQEQLLEFEAWCASNPGNALHMSTMAEQQQMKKEQVSQ
jgi:post-segregation antitoxin (ccd killing protein)